MLKVKDTLRSTVHLTFDGRVIKAYHGPNARERFDNEARILSHLQAVGCPFVPRILESDPDRKSTRLNSSHEWISRMPSSA